MEGKPAADELDDGQLGAPNRQADSEKNDPHEGNRAGQRHQNGQESCNDTVREENNGNGQSSGPGIGATIREQ